MVNSFDNFVCLSGMPRTGSTLLSSVLSQNPKIHAEGNSGLCEIMWNAYQTCQTSAREQLVANNRKDSVFDIVSNIPHSYYINNKPEETIVLDKCRAWTLPANIEMLDKFIGKETKIIVMVRPVIEIVSSFMKLLEENKCHTEENERWFMSPENEPVMKSFTGVMCAKRNFDSGRFLFINYHELINDFYNTLKNVYAFCGWDSFIHSPRNIKTKYNEGNYMFGSNRIKNQHKVRKYIQKRNYQISLMQETIDKCKRMDLVLFGEDKLSASC